MRQNDDFPVQDASVNANAIVNVDFLIYIVQVLSLTFPHGQAQFFSAAAHIGNRAKLTRENLPNKYNIDINQPKDYTITLFFLYSALKSRGVIPRLALKIRLKLDRLLKPLS